VSYDATQRKPCQGCGGPKPSGRGERYCATCRNERHVPTVAPDVQAAMVRAYARIGTTLDQVAAEFYCSTNTVARVLEARGVSVRPRGGSGARRRRLTVDEELTRTRLYGQGLSVAEIADAVGRGPSAIYATLRRVGVAMRPQGANYRPRRRAPVSEAAAAPDGAAPAERRARPRRARTVPPRAPQTPPEASS
jgi:transposase-like protein